METRTGTCHCGAVVFEVDLENGLEQIRRCNCSLCRRKGSIMAGVTLDRLRVIKGAEALRLYTWNSHEAQHWFCGVCGIYTHHQRRSNPNEYGFNIACIEGVDPFEYTDVPVGNGSAQHVV